MKKTTHLFPIALLLGSLPVSAAEKLRFGLNWLPQAEMCGFFQAKAQGLYQQAGLDVDLVSGGPDRNIPLQVAAGDLDLGMGSSFTTLNMLNRNIPARTVAAFLQKDPQTLEAHADQGVETLEDLKGRPIMLAKFSQSEFWQFLKRKFDFSDAQLRSCTYSSVPFLADPQAVQQGYITEDALLLGKQLDKPPAALGAGSRRLSMVAFSGPRDDVEVACLPSCQSAEHPPRYAPVRAGDYIRGKLDASMQIGAS